MVGIPLLVYLIGIILICVGLFFIKPPKVFGWKQDVELVKKSIKMFQRVGLLLLIIGLLIILICVRGWILLNWNQSLGMGDLHLWIVPLLLFLTIGIILLIIGLLWVVLGTHRKRNLLKKLEN